MYTTWYTQGCMLIILFIWKAKRRHNLNYSDKILPLTGREKNPYLGSHAYHLTSTETKFVQGF